MDDQRVACRFAVSGVSLSKGANYGERKPDGTYDEPERYIGTRVTMNGVQGEPFGKYTPIANVEMVINNPAAAAIFRAAFEEYLDGGNGAVDVVFTRRPHQS